MCVYKIEEIAERIRPIAESYGTGKIYLFGSYARGEATEDSDVDLLVDAGEARGLSFYGLYGDLEEVLEKSVDVVTVNALYHQHQGDKLVAKLRDAIEKDRRLIYDKKDKEVIEHMVMRCGRVTDDISRFGNSYTDFISDPAFHDSVSMNMPNDNTE